MNFKKIDDVEGSATERNSIESNPIEFKQFKIRVAVAGLLGISAPWFIGPANAGPGFGVDANGGTHNPTYYANSPAGTWTDWKGVAHASGTALRKFHDCLPMPGSTPANPCTNAWGDTPLNGYIPVATKDTSSYTGSDYYEIGIVEYTQKMHSDLPKATRLRGYVQIDRQRTNGGGNSTGSKGIALTYPDGTTIQVPKEKGIVAPSTVWDHTLVQPIVMMPVYAYDNPTYLGPVISATKGTPVRIKYSNLISTGAAGNLFIPVDKTLPGAGLGPDGTLDYPENRMAIHLHGGHTPWVSDGTPYQWTVPVGEANLVPGTTTYMQGASFQNVPDMAAPGQGSGTLYYTNDQPARLMFYHDHAVGITRLNVYVGAAAGYLINDKAGEGENYSGLQPLLPATQIPLVIQEKTFVPQDVLAIGAAPGQDALWDMTHWGQPGDLWFPHVYEVNQTPSSADGTNPVGRWDWGPWFWPIAPAQFALPTGAYGDVTTTPEAFMDTPLVNGVAYPTLTVDPAAYRFRILNAANDRMLNLGLYVAEPLSVAVTNGGRGYTAPVTVIANGTVVGTASVSPGAITDVTVTDTGSGYTATPNVTIAAPVAGGTAATARAVVGNINTTVGAIVGIVVTNPGSGYATGETPSVNIDHPSCSIGPGCSAASATATVAPAGTITGVTVTAPGTYTTPPAITFSPAPSGVGAIAATAYATLGTEVKMVNFDSSYVPPATISPDGNAAFPTTGGLLGTGWGQQDARVGGVPDPATAGPDIIQIGSEGGLLPALAVIPSTPINYEYNKRSVTVLNVLERGLFMGPAERADAIIDFCRYAGKTLILYNDSPAPVPAGDPRLDYYTNNPDQSATGGMASTLPGYGPNTRTVMQIKVNSGSCTPYDPAPLTAALPAAYGQILNVSGERYQEKPVVGETVYNQPFGMNFNDNYARISTGSGSEPNFTFQDGNPSHVALTLGNPGTGYTTAPTVTIGAPPAGGVQATATASLSVSAITVTNQGNQYTSTPTVSLSAPSLGGVQATARATVTNRRVTAITILNPGYGYAKAPTVTISGGGGNNAAAVATGKVTVATTNPPVPSGLRITNSGSGYISAPTVTLSAPTGTPNGVVAATAIASSLTSDMTSMPVLNKAIQELFESAYGRMNATLGIELPFAGVGQTTIPLAYIDPTTETIADGEIQMWKITHNGVDSHPVHFHLVNVQVINRVGWDGTLKPPHANELGWKETVVMNPLEDIMVAVRAKKPLLKFGLPESSRLMDPSQPVGMTTGFTQIDPVTGNPAVVSNQVANYGWEYVWHCHILGHEENDFMRPIKFTFASTIPAAPTGVTATAVTVSGVRVVNLAWTDPTPLATATAGAANNEVGFKIQRATNNGFTQNLTNLNAPANSTTFTDSTVVAGTRYYYRISTYNAAGSSANSVTVSLIP